MKIGKPVIFGVLTDDREDQSITRSGGDKGNKGTEAAITAIKMIGLLREFNIILFFLFNLYINCSKMIRLQDEI
jgi:hypothetical protein